jgi:hypothetical protein
MSDYLTFLTEGYQKQPLIAITEEELIEELEGVFSPQEIEEGVVGLALKYSGVGEKMTTAAIVAAAVSAAVLAYRRFLSKAAKACKEKSGGAKSECMRSYKIKAHSEKIKTLTASKPKCKQSSDPEFCQAKIEKKINREKAKIKMVQVAPQI